MIFIANCHWNHTKFTFGMIPVAIWYEYHTSAFAVYSYILSASLPFLIPPFYGMISMFNINYVNKLNDDDVFSTNVTSLGLFGSYSNTLLYNLCWD